MKILRVGGILGNNFCFKNEIIFILNFKGLLLGQFEFGDGLFSTPNSLSESRTLPRGIRDCRGINDDPSNPRQMNQGAILSFLYNHILATPCTSTHLNHKKQLHTSDKVKK